MTVVSTKCGKLTGKKEKSSCGESYHSFKGIPYAEPPIGQLRFANPVKVQPWEGERFAHSYGPKSFQFDEFSREILGSEDCLYLNVFTRSETFDEKLPVVVWIHGGGYNFGTGDDSGYGPQWAMDQKWVFVTINYRLGPFGFMAPLGGAVPANLGLKDQRVAVEWVKENIEGFGGDPDNITLMGESAGSASVWQQYLHPDTESEDLFHKVIMQSGSPLCPWANHSTEEANRRVETFLKNVFKCDEIPKGQELKQKLMDLTLKDIKQEVMKGVCAWDMYFTVVHDQEPFNTKVGLKDISHRHKNIPSIISLNKDEGGFMTLMSYIGETAGETIDDDFCLNETMKRDSLDTARVWEHYFGTEDSPNELGMALNHDQKITKVYSDYYFDVPVCMAMERHMKKNDVYLYRYSHQSPYTLYSLMTGGYLEDLGVCHFDEGLILFRNELHLQLPPDDEKIVKAMWRMFFEFTSNGQPRYVDVGGNDITIPKASSDYDTFLEIKQEAELKSGFKPKEYGFWVENGYKRRWDV